jgi:hypothetical protein
MVPHEQPEMTWGIFPKLVSRDHGDNVDHRIDRVLKGHENLELGNKHRSRVWQKAEPWVIYVPAPQSSSGDTYIKVEHGMESILVL